MLEGSSESRQLCEYNHCRALFTNYMLRNFPIMRNNSFLYTLNNYIRKGPAKQERKEEGLR